MFGFVSANYGELTKDQRSRYGGVYCGICRSIQRRSGQLPRLGLSYDMAFLALLHMSLYEPEEKTRENRCLLHPVKRRPFVENEAVDYAADMNVALAYYNFMDDWQDDGKTSARLLAKALEPAANRVRQNWPRQCEAMEECIARLSRLEAENCTNPDLPAAAFGQLMGELLVLREDHWAPCLRQMGDALGRFIYLMDAAMDYDSDVKKGKYNPYHAMGSAPDRQRWENYLVNTIGRCTDAFERLPLVQDKALLDNILYSGVWIQYRGKWKEKEGSGT